MAAAIEGRHEQQEGRHADDGDDEGHAEPVLGLLRRPLVPQLHVTDAHLAGEERGKQVPVTLSLNS